MALAWCCCLGVDTGGGMNFCLLPLAGCNWLVPLVFAREVDDACSPVRFEFRQWACRQNFWAPKLCSDNLNYVSIYLAFYISIYFALRFLLDGSVLVQHFYFLSRFCVVLRLSTSYK